MAQPATLIVSPTSHMDWDWNSSFEEYFKQTTGGAGTGPVQKVLSQAFKLFTSKPTFRFSLAKEQYPMLSLAASLAAAAYRWALQWVADTIPAPKGASGKVVAVYNPVGVARGACSGWKRARP